MSKFRNICLGLIAAAVLTNMSSCSENFLDEEMTTSYNTEYYKTEEGLNTLAISLYANIRYHFAYEWAYGTTNYGTDEFSSGTDLTSEMWNTYDSRLAPYVTGAANKNYPSPQALWDQMYFGINNTNVLIQNAEYFTDENLKTKCLGEAYFLRGYNYLRLVEQYGGVVLSLESKTSVQRNYTRSSAEECLDVIVSDLAEAYKLLPASEFRGKGTFSKPLAAHMLAKALLFRCSERNDAWNSAYKDADLAQIITLTDYVIGERPLASNFADLWDWTGVDCDAEMLPEILMSAQFNNGASTAGRFQNRTYCYFSAQYSNLPYMTRTVAGGLDFQRLRTTEYGCNLFDTENDSRFWKSFKTKYRVNKTSADNEYGIENGDLGIIYIINDKSDNRFDASVLGNGSFNYVDPATSKVVPNTFVNYAGGDWVAQNWGNNRFVSLSKYEDGSRTAVKANGNRDGVLARTGETYLIKAEALVRQGKYQDAIGVVNILRARAEFNDNELREHHVDGGQAASGVDEDNNAYTNQNSYYESLNIPYTTAATSLQIASYNTLPQEDEAILSKLGVASEYDRMLNFILNERSRELYGEFLRWVDLSRTKTLIQRAKAFNAEVTSVEERHYLRPIPQSFIDGLLHEDGANLTQEEQEALQNPGY